MKKKIATLILSFLDWTDYYPKEYIVDKCVMIGAPHTSLWDYFYAIISFWKRDINIVFLFNKNETGIFTPLLKRYGGIDSSEFEGGLVDFSVDLINKADSIILLHSSEGSIKKVEKWRTGFYHIAQKANIPVALGYLDYEDKISGVGDLFYVSGDIKKDFKKIENFYSNFTPKNPKNYSKRIF